MPLRDLQPDDPAELGPFRLRGRLGSGGMGAVYLGFSADGSAVAVKTLLPGATEDARNRLRREAELLARVSNPHVAEFHDADTDGELPWCALSYVAGPALSEIEAPLDEDRIGQLAEGLADGLSALHQVGIVHRDVKPGNIILTHAGPVLVDLGIARAHDITALTQSGTLVGSPAWMAPEQLRGEQTGPATDVWGWGVTVAFAATGRAPFGDEPLAALAWRIQHTEPDLAGAPRSIVAAVTAALAKDPHDRPSIGMLRSTRDAMRSVGAVADTAEDHETSAYADESPTALVSTPRHKSVGKPSSKTKMVALAVGIPVLIAALAVGASALTAGGFIAGQADRNTDHTARPTAPNTEAAREPAQEPTATTSVVIDEVEADLQMFTSALGDDFKSLVFQLQDLSGGATSGVEADAPILGSWWALADWCATANRGTVGSCYDQASSYFRHWFDRDPREINTATWQGAGAIGDYLARGYELTELALGWEPTQQQIPDLTAGRPGIDIRCTPSCAERMDPS
ncbi:serine/threonine-protein kinase [Haloechinothrix sp. LS1_15]|uniref:serine/threonine-protein kinase n=1 Tax=Haloechinothrix sp. LS1_15 TaxID=2652248 RepID=UPI002947D403|nr:serine/threonine-protein kinase [Haloechinothrix sp. LS1_15]MDV6012308.1 serine/threonine protein kinase [Haloechinothrix sp. LS1_15]